MKKTSSPSRSKSSSVAAKKRRARTPKQKDFLATLKTFFEVDSRSITLFRIAFGIAMTISLLNYAPHLQSLFSDTGVYPRIHALDDTSNLRLSLYLANGTVAFQYLLLGVSVVISLLYTLNCKPRLCALLLIFAFQSITYRNVEIKFGVHTCILAMLFFACFLEYPNTSASKKGKRILSIAALGMIVHAFSVSFGAGIAKWNNFDFWITEANAIKQVTSYYTNQNVFSSLLNNSNGLMKALSRFTIFAELLTVPILFIPYKNTLIRNVWLTLTVLLYIGVTMTIHVGLFPMYVSIMTLLLVPTSTWNYLEKTTYYSRLQNSWNSSKQLGRSAQKAMIRLSIVLQEKLAVIAGVFLFIFTINTFNRYVPKNSELFSTLISHTIIQKPLEFLHLHYKWDFVYGGRMDTKLLYAKYTTDNGVYWENLSAVRYTTPFYNYWMNYTNSIMRSNIALQEFGQSLCNNSREEVPASATIQKVDLYIVYGDKNNIVPAPTVDMLYRTHTCKQPVDLSALQKIALPKNSVGNLVGFPILESTQDYGMIQINKNLDQKTIKLGDQLYPLGIGTHANSSITFYVAGSKKFTTVVGIEGSKSNSEHASIEAVIVGDGKKLYSSSLLTGSTTDTIELDIEGVKTLTLKITDGDSGKGNDLIHDDHAAWGNPTIVR